MKPEFLLHATENNPRAKLIRTDEQILQDFHAYRIPGSALNREVSAMASKMGMQQPAEVFISRSKIMNAKMDNNANGHLRVIITEPMLAALGSHPHSSVSEEMKFMLGHELGHTAEGGMKPYLFGGLLPIVALPLIAIGARHYLENAHARQLSREQARDAIQAGEGQDPLLAEYSAPAEPMRHDSAIVSGAKDLAVGALGLGAGSYVAKVNSNLLEFRCDKWGAKMSSPQAGISFFKKIEDAVLQRRQHGVRIPLEDPFAYGEAKGKLMKTYIDFIRHTVGSHPNDASRIKKFEQMIQRGVECAAHIR